MSSNKKAPWEAERMTPIHWVGRNCKFAQVDGSGIPSKSVYLQMLEAEVPIDSNESDLYVPVTPTTTAILKASEHWPSVTTFTSGKPPLGAWYSVPFAYDPFWAAKTRKPQDRGIR